MSSERASRTRPRSSWTRMRRQSTLSGSRWHSFRRQQLRGKLTDEGVADPATIDLLIELHGANLDACLKDANRLYEWADSQDDLLEMGFRNRTANQKALLEHNGSVKAAVKSLVAAGKV